MKKKLTMFVTGFTVMLAAGVATAQIGVWDAPSIDLFASDRPTTAFPAQPEVDLEAEAKALAPIIAEKGTETDTSAEKAADPQPSNTADAAEHQATETVVAGEGPAEENPAEGEPVEKEAPDATPPQISILHPTEGQVFEQSKVAYEGTTEPGARVFAGEYEADVDAEGNWRIVLILSSGANTTKFIAKDRAGNTATATVTAILEAPAKDVTFTAYQKYGATTEGFEKFWGTGTPGTKITVSSEYGTAATSVGEHGEWLVKLVFQAPPGTVFAATVRDSAGHSKVFEVKVLNAAVKEFSVVQKYGSCSETPPYDVFYGTGAPGTVVEIGSPYGSGRTVIGDAGGWDMKVVFEGAPVGVTFDVVLETTAGHRKVFQFTRLEGDAGK